MRPAGAETKTEKGKVASPLRSTGLRTVARVQRRPAGAANGILIYRHTFDSQLAMKGESLYKIATLMGNSPEICRRHYVALLPETLSAIVEFTSPQPPPLAIPALLHHLCGRTCSSLTSFV
jgi:hypothetical protein